MCVANSDGVVNVEVTLDTTTTHVSWHTA